MSTAVEAVFQKVEAGSVPAAVPAPSPSAQDPEEVALPVEGQPETEIPATTEPEPETEPNLEDTPETSGAFDKYKDAFKDHPELGKDWRNIVGREKAYSELGQFSEVKGIIERIPTLEDAETLATQAENHRVLGETFRANPVEFAESLKENDPNAFRQLAVTLPKYLAENDPSAFTEQARYYVDNAIVGMWNDAQTSGDAEYKAAVQVIANRIGYRGAQPDNAAPANSELERLRNEKKTREASDQQASYDNFWQQTDSAIIESSLTEIDATLKKALPSATPAQLDRMKREVWEKTLETINAQPQTRAQIETFRKNALKGKQSIADHKAIVTYATGRAKLVIPKTSKSVIDEWSKSVIQINRETAEKKKDIAAKTRDVGTGPQGTTSSAAAPPPVNNGKIRTQSDVLKELAAGTYVKR